MRLAAQAKMGYFPIPPEVMALVCRHLKLDDKRPNETFLLDPCCGKGAAVKQMADALGIPYGRVYAIELDDARAAEARASMPGVNLLGPCSYFASQIGPAQSFGLVYVNPPFDNELGGGGSRYEETFLRRATYQLHVGGTLVLVCPHSVVRRYDMVTWLDCEYENVRIYKFPDGQGADGQDLRRFREVVVLATRRKAQIPADAVDEHGELSRAGWRDYQPPGLDDLPPVGGVWWGVSRQKDRWGYSTNVKGTPEEEVAVYPVRWAHPPRTFRKTGMTEPEFAQALLDSKLNRLMEHAPQPELSRPPMSLSRGHTALLLASGVLDGPVTDEGTGETHVVRGTSRKETFKAKTEVTENPDTEEVTEKVTWSQRIVLTIRAVDKTGTIYTFKDEAAPEPEPEAEPASANVTVTVVGQPDLSGAADLMRDIANAMNNSPAAESARDTIQAIECSREARDTLAGGASDNLPALSAASDGQNVRRWPSYKVGVRFSYGNGDLIWKEARFPTEDKARTWAHNFVGGNAYFSGYEVVGCDDEPNRED